VACDLILKGKRGEKEKKRKKGEKGKIRGKGAKVMKL